jgi:hypothetical protein
MSNETSPNFVVKKDLFNYFDSKSDGVIDLAEWQQVFKKIEVKILNKKKFSLTRFRSNLATCSTSYSTLMEKISQSLRSALNLITYLK